MIQKMKDDIQFASVTREEVISCLVISEWERELSFPAAVQLMITQYIGTDEEGMACAALTTTSARALAHWLLSAADEVEKTS